MTDFPQFEDSDDGFIDDPSSPFFGLPTGNTPTTPDPYEIIEDEVARELGVDTLGDIFIPFADADPNGLRGNRFGNIIDAIRYLAEAGIIQFSNVTINDEGDIGLEIDPDTQRFTP